MFQTHANSRQDAPTHIYTWHTCTTQEHHIPAQGITGIPVTHIHTLFCMCMPETHYTSAPLIGNTNWHHAHKHHIPTLHTVMHTQLHHTSITHIIHIHPICRQALTYTLHINSAYLYHTLLTPAPHTHMHAYPQPTHNMCCSSAPHMCPTATHTHPIADSKLPAAITLLLRHSLNPSPPFPLPFGLILFFLMGGPNTSPKVSIQEASHTVGISVFSSHPHLT